MRRDKKKFLEVYKNALGNVSVACENFNISRQAFYKWKNTDQEFARQIDDVNEGFIDFAETMLLKNIREGKESSIFFYLKTKGKTRGYIEKQESDVNINGFEQLMRSLPDEVEDE